MADMERIELFAEYEIPSSWRDHFMSGVIWKEWAEKFPQIFDKEDCRLANNQPQYHFYEWCAAVKVYESTGYLSLVEKYQYKAHPRKQKIWHQLADEKTLAFIRSQKRAFQLPDLLVYAEDLSDWFFCEVKGPTDRLRPEQEQYFQAVSRISGKPVKLIKIRFS